MLESQSGSGVGALMLAFLFGCSGPAAPQGEHGQSLGREQSEFQTYDQTKLMAWDAWHEDRFGNAVSLFEERALVGSATDDDLAIVDRGSAFVFGRWGDVWTTETKLLAGDAVRGDNFGSAVAMGAGTALIGASGCDVGANTDQGAVYAFVLGDTGGWTQAQKLVAADGGVSGERLGSWLALHEDTLAVGARGSVRVFERSDSTWLETAKILPPPGASANGFGSVALSGDTLLVGATHDSVGGRAEQGAVHVYVRSGAGFELAETLVASDGMQSDHFGAALAFADDTVVIGTASTSSTGGRLDSAYVFVRSGGGFLQQAKLNASDQAASDGFGRAVAVQADVAIVGAPFHEHGGNENHGSAYVFSRSGSEWSEVQEAFAWDRQNNDYFGSAVAISGYWLLAGSPNDDHPYAANGSAYALRLEYYVGERCTTAGQCQSGFCVEGVCCTTACEGACDACTRALGATNDGFCENVPRGAPGNPACSGAACTGDSPVCPPVSHLPCASDGDCNAGEYCSATGICLPQKADGRACEPVAGGDCLGDGCAVCASGYCADGFCCDSACTGGCSACSSVMTGVANGTCSPVSAGLDPKDACAPDAGFPGSCGADGACDGNGFCRVAPQGTPCGQASCAGDAVATFACDGAGHCIESVLSCGPSGSGGTGSGGGGGTGSGTGGTGTGTGGTGSAGDAGAGGSSGGGGTTGTGGGGGAGGTGGSGGGPLTCGTTPCQNGGTCVDESYACLCPPGFLGDDCSYQLRGLATGYWNNCAIRTTDGSVECWGSSVEPVPGGSFLSVSAGFSYACGVRGSLPATSGPVECWSAGYPVATPPTGSFRSISSTDHHSCGIREDGTVACWGSNSGGQLDAPPGTFDLVRVGASTSCALSAGLATCWGSSSPGPLSPPPGLLFQDIGVGYQHACGLTIEGTIACWGAGESNQLEAPPGEFVAIAVGSGHSCALGADGVLACWGSDFAGQSSPPPGVFPVGSELVIGGFHSCVNSPETGIVCWGNNSFGESVSRGGLFKHINSRGRNACALTLEGELRCWVDRDEGIYLPPSEGKYRDVAMSNQAGCAVRDDKTLTCWHDLFDEAPPEGEFEAVTVGGDFACALRQDGTPACWGNVPGPVSGVLTSISASGHVCGIRADHSLECWGNDSWGQATPPPGAFQAVSATYEHTCGVKLDGTLICWGRERPGVQPSGTFLGVSAGPSQNCAIRSDGSLACWGESFETDVLNPPAGAFIAVDMGRDGTGCAIRSNRTLVCWGASVR